MMDLDIHQGKAEAHPGYRLRPRNRSRYTMSYRGLALFASYAILVLMIVGPYMTFKPRPYTGEGSVLRQGCYLLVFGLLLFASRVTSYPARILVIPTSIALTLGWFWLSLTWAIEPDIAVRRLLLTTLIVLCAFIAVELVGYRSTLRAMRQVMVVTLIINYVAAIAFPTLGTHTAGTVEGFGLDPALIGEWRGVMQQKNFAGAFCALTILAFVFDGRSIPFAIRSAVIVAATYYLYRSGAKSSIGIVVLALMGGISFLIYNPRNRLLILLLAATALVLMVGVALFYWSQIAGLFARPDAFTGRVQIWSMMLMYWQDHQLGSGFGSFWNIGNESPVYQYTKEGSWVALVAIGHSGYMDLLVQTGLPGLLLAIASTSVIPVMTLFNSLDIDRSRGALLLSFLIFCAGHNLTETSLFDRDAIIQVVLMFTIALVHVEARDRQPADAGARLRRRLA